VSGRAYFATSSNRKRLIFSLASQESATFLVAADLSGAGLWTWILQLAVPPGPLPESRFADAFGPYWLRLVAQKGSTATVTFLYE
jgi:hypothetical protein